MNASPDNPPRLWHRLRRVAWFVVLAAPVGAADDAPELRVLTAGEINSLMAAHEDPLPEVVKKAEELFADWRVVPYRVPAGFSVPAWIIPAGRRVWDRRKIADEDYEGWASQLVCRTFVRVPFGRAPM